MSIFSVSRRRLPGRHQLLHHHHRLLSTSIFPPTVEYNTHRLLSTSIFPPTVEYNTLRRLSRAQNFSQIESLLEPFKSLNPSNNPLPSSQIESHLIPIINSYAVSGMIDHALKTLSQIPTPSSLSLNAFLSSLNLHPRLFREVPSYFQMLFPKFFIAPDEVSYGVLIKSLCKCKKAAYCMKLLEEMEKRGVKVTTVAYTTILDSLYKEKKLVEAEKLWKTMKKKGVELDVPAYNVRIMGRMAGEVRGVMEIFKEIEQAGLKPDTITYNYLMSCYCNNGKFVDAKKVYERIKEPNCKTFKLYMVALCKKGDLVGAVKVFSNALEKEKVPDLGVVKLLVDKLMKGKKEGVAKWAVAELKKQFAEDFTGGWLELEKMVCLHNDGQQDDEGLMGN